MGQSVGVSVTVKNTGKVAGMEVVQLVRHSSLAHHRRTHTHDTTPGMQHTHTHTHTPDR
jgi:hypothetical protein